MNAVIAALKDAGGKDLQTQQVSLFPQTDEQGKVTGYVAQNTVSAKAKIAGAGALIDAAAGAGANTVDGPREPVGSRCDLPQRAEAGSRERTRQGARPRRGRRVRCRPGLDGGGAGRRAQPVFAEASASAKALDSTPVEPGTQDVTADVTVSFTIRERATRSVRRQGPFAAGADAAGGALALGDVHRQRLLARAPQRSRFCQARPCQPSFRFLVCVPRRK